MRCIGEVRVVVEPPVFLLSRGVPHHQHGDLHHVAQFDQIFGGAASKPCVVHLLSEKVESTLRTSKTGIPPHDAHFTPHGFTQAGQIVGKCTMFLNGKQTVCAPRRQFGWVARGSVSNRCVAVRCA